MLHRWTVPSWLLLMRMTKGMKNQFMKVSSIPAQCAIIKLHVRVVLKVIKNLFMKVSSIPAQCVIINLKIRVN